MQTAWRDRHTVLAPRATGEPPAPLALLDRLGAPYSYTVYTVKHSIKA
jgi:hypothetical protein